MTYVGWLINIRTDAGQLDGCEGWRVHGEWTNQFKGQSRCVCGGEIDEVTCSLFARAGADPQRAVNWRSDQPGPRPHLVVWRIYAVMSAATEGAFSTHPEYDKK